MFNIDGSDDDTTTIIVGLCGSSSNSSNHNENKKYNPPLHKHMYKLTFPRSNNFHSLFTALRKGCLS